MSWNVMPTLRRRQARAVTALLSEPTVSAVASEVGVTDRTLYRWLATREFRDALDQAGSRPILTSPRTRRLGCPDRPARVDWMEDRVRAAA